MLILIRKRSLVRLAAVILDLLQHPAVDTISPPGFQPASNVASADGSNAGAQGYSENCSIRCSLSGE